VALLSQRGEVRHVVGVLLRLEHPALDAELLLGPEEAEVVEVVEGAVVQPADVGDETDLELLAAGGGRAGGRVRGGAAAGLLASAAARRDERERDGQEGEPSYGHLADVRSPRAGARARGGRRTPT